MERKTLLLIYNPKAGQGLFVKCLHDIIDMFSEHGFIITAYPTREKLDAYRTVLSIGRGYDCVVASGGDGTLNEVVSALVQFERKPAFGYIPSGTTNDFAHSAGLPTEPLLAAEVICSGNPLPIDIGRFNGRYFSYVAAFGLFTDVTYETPQGMKNDFGHAAYVLEGVKRLAGVKSWRCAISCDGEKFEGEYILGIITNATSVGGFKLPQNYADIQDGGKFVVILLKRIRRFKHLQEIISTLLGGENADSDYFTIRAAKHIVLSCGDSISWTLDGEFGGTCNTAEIDVLDGALTIMSPRKEA